MHMDVGQMGMTQTKNSQEGNRGYNHNYTAMSTELGLAYGDFSKGCSLGRLKTRMGLPMAAQPLDTSQETCHYRAVPPASPPELVSSKDVCLLVLAPVKSSIHSLDIRGQPQAGQRLRVPSLQGAS